MKRGRPNSFTKKLNSNRERVKSAPFFVICAINLWRACRCHGRLIFQSLPCETQCLLCKRIPIKNFQVCYRVFGYLVAVVAEFYVCAFGYLFKRIALHYFCACGVGDQWTYPVVQNILFAAVFVEEVYLFIFFGSQPFFYGSAITFRSQGIIFSILALPSTKRTIKNSSRGSSALSRYLRL